MRGDSIYGYPSEQCDESRWLGNFRVYMEGRGIAHAECGDGAAIDRFGRVALPMVLGGC